MKLPIENECNFVVKLMFLEEIYIMAMIVNPKAFFFAIICFALPLINGN